MTSSSNPDVKVRVGILTTIAKSIYSDTLMKIREAVSNSMDNYASKFVFSLEEKEEENTYSLSLFDNGHGITNKRITDILQSIGYGFHRDTADAKKFYSYFGLGLMSIFQLGKKITIITRPKGSKEINKLVVDSKSIFSKKIEKEHFDILKKFFTVDKASMKERSSLSHLSDNTIKSIFGNIPNNFTEIIINDINKADIFQLTDINFIKKVSKLLPLEVEENHLFLNSLEKSHKKKIIDILKNKKFCPTIKFYYSSDSKTKHKELKKYFPRFRTTFRKGNYDFAKHEKNGFVCYVLAAGKDLGEDKDEGRETGIWVRNKNFLVKAADYLQYQGSGSFVSQPIKNWIFAEVFHENMNDFLEPSRKEYIISNDSFKSFRDAVKQIFEPISKEIRKSYDIANDVVKVIKEPFDNIIKDDDKSPFRKLEKNIASIEKVSVDEMIGDKATDIFNKLGDIRNKELEKSPEVIKQIQKKKIILADEEDHYVEINPKVTEESVKFNHLKKRVEAVIPSNIFERKEITLLGEAFWVYFVYDEIINKGISFNIKNKIIYVNIAYKELKNYSISFLDVLIAAEYAYLSIASKSSKCNSAVTLECLDDMKETILRFLGTEKNLSSYIDSLKNYFK